MHMIAIPPSARGALGNSEKRDKELGSIAPTIKTKRKCTSRSGSRDSGWDIGTRVTSKPDHKGEKNKQNGDGSKIRNQSARDPGAPRDQVPHSIRMAWNIDAASTKTIRKTANSSEMTTIVSTIKDFVRSKLSMPQS